MAAGLGLGLNFGQSRGTSTGYTGVTPQYKGVLSGQAVGAVGAGLPFASKVLGYQGPTGQFGIDPRTGLPSNMTAMANQMGLYGFSNASAQAAAAGRNRPENMPGVIGSAIQNVLPQLAPYGMQTYQNMFQLPYQNLGAYGGYLNLYPSLLGGYNQAQQRAVNYGLAGTI